MMSEGHSSQTEVKMEQESSDWPRRYGVGLLIAALAIAIRSLIDEALPGSPLLFFPLPVVLAAWYGGFGPGLLVTLTSSLFVGFFLMEPTGPSTLLQADVDDLVLYLVEATFLSWLVGAFRASRRDQTRALGALEEELARRTVAEESVRKSEAEFRMMFDLAYAGMAEVDITNGRFLRVNGRYCEITGYSEEELLQRTTLSLNHPDENREDRIRIGRLFSGEVDRYTVEKRFIHKDGAVIWVTVDAALLRDESGRPYRAVGVVQDITARKRAEEELRQSREEIHLHLAQLRTIYETAPVGLAFVDTDLRFARVNGKMAALCGGAAADLVGKRPRDVVPGDFAGPVEAALQRVLASGEPVHNEKVIGRTHDGAEDDRHWLVNCHTVRDERGAILGINTVVQDISEFQKIEEALRRSEHRFRIIFEAAPVAIMEQDYSKVKVALDRLVASGVGDLERYIEEHPEFVEEAIGLVEICDANPAALKLIGAAEKRDVLGPLTRFLKPDDTPGFSRELLAVVRGESQLSFETVRSTLQGGEIDVLTTIALPAATGSYESVLVSSIDISERARSQRELLVAKEAAEEANRMKSVFLANMSHEIRTPLTSILGFAGLLKKQVSGKGRLHADRIEKSGVRLSETLDAVLTLARLEAGRARIMLDELRVAHEVREIAALYQAEAAAKGLTLVVLVEPAARTVRSHLDRGAFTSVVQNLISNAIKFTDDGEVRVSVGVDRGGTEDARVRVEVTDTGRGISKAFLPRLFEPFTQESEGLTRTHGGTGLGLSIAKQLAEKMGGHIDVESEPGRGSRFTVSFPAVVGSGTDSDDEVCPPPAETASRRHVVLVEDDHDTRELLGLLLADRYDCTVFATGTEALMRLQGEAAEGRSAFDLMIADINLGEGPSGVDLLHYVRSTPEYADRPIIALTALALPGDSDRLLGEGFDAYVSKPFSADELLDVVSHALTNGEA